MGPMVHITVALSFNQGNWKWWCQKHVIIGSLLAKILTRRNSLPTKNWTWRGNEGNSVKSTPVFQVHSWSTM